LLASLKNEHVRDDDDDDDEEIGIDVVVCFKYFIGM